MKPPVLIPIFGGQGMASFENYKTSSILTLSSAMVLLDACHAAFHDEIASLSSNELSEVDICISDFKNKNSILFPPHDRYLDNPVLSGSILSLFQSLSYLAYVEGTVYAQGLQSCFTTVLQSNITNSTGVLGFSSGIISSCVVATSPSIPVFIANALQAYRLAIWIGIRSQIYRLSLWMSYNREWLDSIPSWSIVLGGLTKDDVQRVICTFNEPFGQDHITITAVMGRQLVTISGDPYHLSAFTRTLPIGVAVHEIKINALYHRADLAVVRRAVLADVVSRNIRFPTFADIITPIRSTFNGELILKSYQGPNTLVQEIVDMVLIHPVNWDVVLENCTASLPKELGIKLLSIGLSAGLIKCAESTFSQNPGHSCQVVNFTDSVVASKPKIKQEPIAIIGMAVNMPGAPNVDALWDILDSGRSTLSTIPEDRFDLKDYKNRLIPGRTLKASTGNFIEGVGNFDHKFFNISTREARSMDPQQRLLLEVGYHALEDAGYVPNSSPTFDPATFGCFIGAATHDYVHNLKNDIDIYYSTGTLTAFLSGRLSYCLGLSGPSMVVDTACSSSMVAIHQAVRALMNQDCHAALAGGVNVISSPDMFIGLDRGHFLSATGQCKSFDALADGYSRSEGCGVFVLKRLEDALAENDRILGVIRGIEVNQSGTAQSITHPHVPTQEDLFRQLLSRSDIKSNSISLVEAHGTGTQAGDTSELESIRHVLAADRTPDNLLNVTSIKANTGHLEAASGSASLAKILLMFQHKTIPRQISLNTLNPKIAQLDADYIVIPTKNMPWSPKGGSRIALLNNFGAAGSNTALVVEEYMLDGSRPVATTGALYVFGLSAKDESSLEILRSEFLTWLRMPANHDIPLLDIAYTAIARRQIHRYRLAFAAMTKNNLIKELTTSPIFDAKQSSSLVLVFSGQGSQYRGMGRTLYGSCALFKRHIDECNFILTSCGFAGIISMITGRETCSLSATTDPEEQQTAIFALEYSLAKLWISWGIKPVAVMGHSLGEYAALVIAGVTSLKDTLLIVATRARLMLDKCAKSSSGMLAISLGPDDVQAILNAERRFSDLSIACYNSPHNCVVSGPLPSLQNLAQYLKETNAKVTHLCVPYGYHSPAMSILTEDLVNMSRKLKTSSTRLPFISTVLGQVVMPSDPTFPPKDYLARHCIEPVRFIDAVESFHSSSIFCGTAVWLEIGPHPTALGLLKSFPALSRAVLVSSLHQRQDSWLSLSSALATLYVSNCAVDWRGAFKNIGSATCISLPSYPFTRHNFWVPFAKENTLKPSNRGSKYSLIRNWSQNPDNNDSSIAIFETPLEYLKYYIKGHRVGGIPLCPGSVYLELVYAAINLRFDLPDTPGHHAIVLRQVVFPKPLTCSSDGSDKDGSGLSVTVDISDSSFSVRPQVTETATEVVHANGTYELIPISEIENRFASYHSTFDVSFENLTTNLKDGIRPDTFSTRTIYEVIFPRVVDYSKDFHTLRSLTISPDGLEATGVMQIEPTQCEAGQFAIHPMFLDTFLHTAGFLSNLRGDLNDAYICSEIGAVHILPQYFADVTASFTIYCKISTTPSESCMIGETYARSTGPNKYIVASFEGIRFQRVRLSGLKVGLATLAVSGESSRSDPRNMSEKDSISGAIPSKGIVCQLVAKACEMDPDDLLLNKSFDELGIDSLMRLELSYDLSKAFPAFGYMPEELHKCSNVKDLIDLIQLQDNVASPRTHIDHSPLRTPISSTPGCFSYSGTLVHSSHLDSANSPVRRIFANILDMEEDAIKDDSELGSLGFDSFASIEALHTLRRDYNLEVPHDLFIGSQTVGDVEQQVAKLEPSYFSYASPGWIIPRHLSENPFKKTCEALSAKNSLVMLQNSTSNLPPLVLIHDGSGLTISYERISKLDRRVWAISNPRFLTSDPWDSIVEMARAYSNLIFDEIEGPMILGGWSFGGVVAFEIARHLKPRSTVVKGVILIDSPNPSTHVPLPQFLIEEVLDAAENIDFESRKLCKKQFMMNAQLLSHYSPQVQNGYYARLVFLRSVEPYISPSQQSIPSWLSDRTDTEHITTGWKTISRGQSMKILDIPGHHFEAFDRQNVALVSSSIKEACKFLDDQHLVRP